MFTYLLLLSFVPGAWILYNAYCLMVNYRRASQLKIPTVCIPVSPDSPVWLALQTGFTSVFKYIPFDAVSFTRHCRLGWEFHDRYKTNERLGDAWMLVTRDRNWLYVAQAEAAHDIFSRSREFGRPVWMLASLDVFGPNVSTAEGPDWQRQRKLTATPFNEQKSSLVWAESVRQANDMVHSWLSHDRTGLTSTSEDTRTLALDVLAFAGFQKSYPFRSTADGQGVETPSSYRDSLSLILRNALVIMVLPEKAFHIPFLPSTWRQIGRAITEFRKYMLQQIADEKMLMAEGKPGSGTLVSNLVRASDDRSENTITSAVKKLAEGEESHEVRALTVDEILGNIFVFNFAGHDTTAISMSYAMLLLVAHPEIQDWISEELNFYLSSGNSESWRYEAVFPKLNRCLAVLPPRLYNPLPGIPKYTGHQTRSLTVNHKLLIVPADTLVVPNLMALHTYPRYWGQDSLTWRPSRWILPSSKTTATDLGTQLSQEHLLTPEKGTFIAWSDGARNCPGKKFAQVEFVATMAALFRDYRVMPVAKKGETPDGARRRVLGVVKDSNVELLLQMRDPDSVAVTWSRK